MSNERLSRRSFLAATGVSATAAVAGCLSNDDNGEFTIAVGPDGNNIFDPDAPGVEPGTTVIFEWESDGHNIVLDSAPDGSEWDGVPEIQDEGYEHQHTFDVEGQYDFHCEPHRADGMVGVLVVGDIE